jgi:RNA recognition motif-containing protein
VKEHADKMADRGNYSKDGKDRDGGDVKSKLDEPPNSRLFIVCNKNTKKDRDGGDTKPKLDEPPNSRLFIVCNKNITEEEFRSAFEKYGTIEEIWVVRDRNTGAPKGKQVALRKLAAEV